MVLLKSPKAITGAACAMSLAVIAAGTYLVAPRPRCLLDTATRVSETADWAETRAGGYTSVNFVLTGNREVIYPRKEGAGRVRLMRKRLGLTRAPSTPLPLLLPASASAWQLSPDGRYLVWGADELYVSSIDGAEARQLPASANRVLWSADGCRVVWRAYRPGSPAICSLDVRSGTTVSNPVKIDPSAQAAWQKAPLLHCFPDDRLRAGFPGWRRLSAPRAAPLLFADLDSRNRYLPTHQWQIAPPDGSAGGLVIPSPDGQRLLWLASNSSVSGIDAVIHRIWRSYKMRWISSVSLYVSNAYGGGMHQIAADETGRAPGLWMGWRWAPDNKTIAFVAKNGLYTLNAE